MARAKCASSCSGYTAVAFVLTVTSFSTASAYVFKFDRNWVKLKESRKRQMVGESESSASSILCSTEYEPGQADSLSIEVTEGTRSGDDSSFSSTLSFITLSLCHSVTCVLTTVWPFTATMLLLSVKHKTGERRKKKNNIPLYPHHHLFYVLISSDSNHCLLAHFALVMSKSSSHILEWLDN